MQCNFHLQMRLQPAHLGAAIAQLADIDPCPESQRLEAGQSSLYAQPVTDDLGAMRRVEAALDYAQGALARAGAVYRNDMNSSSCRFVSVA